MARRLDNCPGPAPEHLRKLARTDPAVEWILRVVEEQAQSLDKCAKVMNYNSWWLIDDDWPAPPMRLP